MHDIPVVSSILHEVLCMYFNALILSAVEEILIVSVLHHSNCEAKMVKLFYILCLICKVVCKFTLKGSKIICINLF